MTGVIAQDVQKVLPDAVSRSGPCTLSNGQAIDDVLIVDKDRIFIGNNFYHIFLPAARLVNMCCRSKDKDKEDKDKEDKEWSHLAFWKKITRKSSEKN